MGTAIEHHVSDRVICNFWHPGTLTLSPERQSARMSKITNDCLTRSGTGCCTHMATVGVTLFAYGHSQCSAKSAGQMHDPLFDTATFTRLLKRISSWAANMHIWDVELLLLTYWTTEKQHSVDNRARAQVTFTIYNVHIHKCFHDHSSAGLPAWLASPFGPVHFACFNNIKSKTISDF